MTLSCMMLALCLGMAGNEQMIDSFEYGHSSEAQAAWAASPGTPLVQAAREGGRLVTQFGAPFGSNPKLERTILDRRVKLDLASAGEFTLAVAADRPEAVGHVTLYFHSPNGWYGASAGLTTTGWQTLRFSKASFTIEDKPAGWHKIDNIRISIWRGQAVDATCRLANLTARWNDVALILPGPSDKQSAGDLAAARKVSDDLAGMLAELGLGSDAIDETAVARGALKQRHVAILAHHPWLDDKTASTIEQFVQQGGKLFACYSLPPRLTRLLGVARMEYLHPEKPGTLAEIRFNASDLPGLPLSVRQASWNINIVEPSGPETRIIGRWYDGQGKPTGYPAMLINDNGAYFSHVVLTDDRTAKKQMLAAVLGELYPPLWPKMASTDLDRIGKVGHLSDVDTVARFVQSTRNRAAIERLNAAMQAKNAAAQQFARKDYPASVQSASHAQELLADAYVRAVPSRKVEGRAFWNHSGTGAYPGDWDRTAKELAAAGFNMVIPNMLWAGRAHYASDVLPRSETYDKYGDQIAQCVAAARKFGLEVHVWKVNHNLSGAPKDFIERLGRENRLQAGRTGQTHNWLCPSHPANFRLEVDSMVEVARKYDVDGLHFDYIRYPDRDRCYCDGCRSRFQAETRLTVSKWPEDCHSGALHDRYHDWRCAQITRLVAAVHQEAKKLKPNIKISAAVFGAYPECRESVGQDWVAWVKAGYLDFVCPMDYSQSDLSFANLVQNQLKLIGGRIPMYPGIGAWKLTSHRSVGQIHLARTLGAAGFTIFNLNAEAAESLLPSVAAGAGSQRAVLPHRRH